MTFTLTLDLTEPVGGDDSAGKMLVRPSRLLLDADGSGAVVYTTNERSVAPVNGVCTVELPSTDEFDGAAWFGVRWPGHMDDLVWVPAQAAGETTTVRAWIDDPQIIPPPVSALPGIYDRLDELGGVVASPTQPTTPGWQVWLQVDPVTGDLLDILTP